MSGFGPRAHRSLDVARTVYACLERHSVGAAIIGSIALAAHGYVRATRDLDFGVAVFPFASLQALASRLRDQGHAVDVGEPAPDDPLGGILTVSGAGFDSVQIVNLRAPDGRHEKLARAAISAARTVPELGLPVVDVPHLVALKLVAGSRKDELDILELLKANPEMPMDSVLEVCARHRLKARLERLLAARG